MRCWPGPCADADATRLDGAPYCSRRLSIRNGLFRRLAASMLDAANISFHTPATMRNDIRDQRRVFGWALPTSIALHLLIVAFLLFGLPATLSQPGKEQAIAVDIVPPPKRRKKPNLRLPLKRPSRKSRRKQRSSRRRAVRSPRGDLSSSSVRRTPVRASLWTATVRRMVRNNRQRRKIPITRILHSHLPRLRSTGTTRLRRLAHHSRRSPSLRMSPKCKSR